MNFLNTFAGLFSNFGNLTWQMVVMWGIGALLIYLAIAKKMEPSLLLPMGFGAILVNLPLSGAITQGETVGPISALFEAGMSNELFPLLLFIGIGYHPAFRIPFDASHTTTDYEFRFDQPESPMILDAYPNGLLTGRCGYRWKNVSAIPLTDDLFANDSFCMAGLRTKTVGIYEKDTGRHIVCNVEGYPYSLIWSAPAKPVRFVCIEPWQSLPGAEDDPQDWNQRAAAACLAPGEEWATTLSTTFER